MTGHGNYMAYYADSFGQRPNRYGLSSSSSSTSFLGDLATISYNRVRMAILNHWIPESGGEISFNDVSVPQQQDHASCGVYALENAHS